LNSNIFQTQQIGSVKYSMVMAGYRFNAGAAAMAVQFKFGDGYEHVANKQWIYSWSGSGVYC
jgi:hypothetical protein